MSTNSTEKQVSRGAHYFPYAVSRCWLNIHEKLNSEEEERKGRSHEEGVRILEKEPGRSWGVLQGVGSCTMLPKKVLFKKRTS